MALILSLKEGHDFFVDEERFELHQILGENEFIIKAMSDPNGKPPKQWRITDECNQEIMSDVFVSAGEMHQISVASVVVEAPRSILILRGDLKRAGAVRGTA